MNQIILGHEQESWEESRKVEEKVGKFQKSFRGGKNHIKEGKYLENTHKWISFEQSTSLTRTRTRNNVKHKTIEW